MELSAPWLSCLNTPRAFETECESPSAVIPASHHQTCGWRVGSQLLCFGSDRAPHPNTPPTPHTHSANKLIIATLPVLHHFPHCSNSRPCPKVSVVRAFLLFNDLVCGIEEKKIYISNLAPQNSKITTKKPLKCCLQRIKVSPKMEICIFRLSATGLKMLHKAKVTTKYG